MYWTISVFESIRVVFVCTTVSKSLLLCKVTVQR